MPPASMNHLLKFLFHDSQDDKNLLSEDVLELFEDAEEIEKLEIEKKPLEKALKAMGVNGTLVETPGGLRMEFDDETEYNDVRHKLLSPESAYPLAQSGWVATSSNDVNNSEELPKFVINFIDLQVAETGDAKEAEDLATLIKQAQELDDAHAADTKPSGGVEHKYTESVLKPGKKAAHIDAASNALVERIMSGKPFDMRPKNKKEHQS